MDTNTNRVLAKRQAWGTTLSATPIMKELHERVEGWFVEGLSEEEVRRRLCHEAVTAEYGLRAFLGVPRRTMRMAAAEAVVVVAQSWGFVLFAIVGVIVLIVNRKAMLSRDTGVTDVLLPDTAATVIEAASPSVATA